MLNKFQKSTPKNKTDLVLTVSFGFLLLLGLIVLSSASAYISFQKYNDSYYLIKHQILSGLLPGLILLIFFAKIDYKYWKKFSLAFLLISIGLLIAVFIPNVGTTFGTTAKSWINVAGISFQPAELVKLTFLLYLATLLERKGEKGVKDFYYGLLPFLFVLGIIALLMLMQPDLGTLSIIIFMSMAVFFASGARIKHVLSLIFLGCTSIYLLILNSSYRAQRLTTFLHPELDPQGIGYHINQAFLAIGSGGFWGRGIGHSRQKFLYLPEATGDSIFAIMAEELGFFLSILVLGLFVFIAYKCFKLAQKTPDQFGKLVIVGIISWFLFQAFFNISSMVGLSPMTGVPLPFISYGGTAMAINMAAIGIILNISKNQTN